MKHRKLATLLLFGMAMATFWGSMVLSAKLPAPMDESKPRTLHPDRPQAISAVHIMDDAPICSGKLSVTLAKDSEFRVGTLRVPASRETQDLLNVRTQQEGPRTVLSLSRVDRPGEDDDAPTDAPCVRSLDLPAHVDLLKARQLAVKIDESLHLPRLEVQADSLRLGKGGPIDELIVQIGAADERWTHVNEAPETALRDRWLAFNNVEINAHQLRKLHLQGPVHRLSLENAADLDELILRVPQTTRLSVDGLSVFSHHFDWQPITVPHPKP